MKKYALQFYYATGSNKYDRAHREEFDNMTDCLQRLDEALENEPTLNPTIRMADTDSYISYSEAVKEAEREKADRLVTSNEYLSKLDNLLFNTECCHVACEDCIWHSPASLADGGNCISTYIMGKLLFGNKEDVK